MGVCWGRRTINKKCMRARILDNSLLDVHNHPSLCDTHTQRSLLISPLFLRLLFTFDLCLYALVSLSHSLFTATMMVSLISMR